MSLEGTKQKFEQAKSNVAINQARYDETLSELKKEFDVDTLEEAQNILTILEKKVIDLQNKRDELIKKANDQLEKFEG